MNAMKALHDEALRYPGGIKGLAADMGYSYPTLCLELNPSVSSNKLGFETALLMMRFIRARSGTHEALQQVADELDLIIANKADPADTRHSSLTDSLLDLHQHSAQVSAEVRDALADGVVTQKELTAIRNRTLALREEAVALDEKLGAVAQKPGNVRQMREAG